MQCLTDGVAAAAREVSAQWMDRIEKLDWPMWLNKHWLATELASTSPGQPVEFFDPSSSYIQRCSTLIPFVSKRLAAAARMGQVSPQGAPPPLVADALPPAPPPPPHLSQSDQLQSHTQSFVLSDDDDERDHNAGAQAAKQRQRLPQICQQCFHYRFIGTFGDRKFHPMGAKENRSRCLVPLEHRKHAKGRPILYADKSSGQKERIRRNIKHGQIDPHELQDDDHQYGCALCLKGLPHSDQDDQIEPAESHSQGTNTTQEQVQEDE